MEDKLPNSNIIHWTILPQTDRLSSIFHILYYSSEAQNIILVPPYDSSQQPVTSPNSGIAFQPIENGLGL
jgi:hypothetical protein